MRLTDNERAAIRAVVHEVQALGEQRVDVVVVAPNVIEEPIHRVARAPSVAP